MPISNNYKFLSLFLMFGLPFICQTAGAQVVWEDSKNPIHQFLSRQAQKGNIEITDFILPLSRKEIAADLAILKDSIYKLSSTEKKELDFYLKEYSEFNGRIVDTTLILKKDQWGRLRLLTVNTLIFYLEAILY